jgi:hypothetical protein
MKVGSKIFISLVLINIALIMIYPSQFLSNPNSYEPMSIVNDMGFNLRNTTINNETTIVTNITNDVNSTSNPSYILGLADSSGSYATTIAKTVISLPILILNFLILVVKMVFAPITILSSMKAPNIVIIFGGVTMALIYLFELAGMIRGIRL